MSGVKRKHIVTAGLTLIIIFSSLALVTQGAYLQKEVRSEDYMTMPSNGNYNSVLENASQQVNIYKYYTAEPAPMGIADYGIGYNGSAYNYSTSSFLGNVTIRSISMVSPALGSYEISIQLNLNLVFSHHNVTYDYWVQNVALLNTSSLRITFIDNIWNISSPNASMFNSTVAGNGTVASTHSSSGTSFFYYSYSNSSLPGNNVTLRDNSSFLLRTDAHLGHNISPEVSFLYNDGFGWVVYDNVLFKFASNMTEEPFFYVDGFSYNPANTYYDAELVVGGPGNSSQTEDVNSSILLMLEYFNGNNYQAVPNAFNFGSDTAETAFNVVSSGTYGSITGRLAAYITSGLGFLGPLYYSKDLSSLKISSNVSEGALYIKSANYTGSPMNITSFIGGRVNVTLFPGKYVVEIFDYSTGTFQNYGTVSLRAGEQTVLQNYSYEVRFIENGLPSGSTWYLNVSGIHSGPINGSQYVLYLQNGSYNYTFSTGDREYRAVNGSGALIVNGTKRTVEVQFIPVLYAIRFVESGLPAGTSWSVTLNGNGVANSTNDTITFHVTNGTYDYLIPSTSEYAPSTHTGSASVNGSSVTVTVRFSIIDGYLVGKVSPSYVVISVNGTVYKTNNGSFNITLAPGKYSVMISAAGYKSYQTNVTITPMSVTHLPIRSLEKISNADILIEIVIFTLLFIGGIWSIIWSKRRR